MSIGTFGGGKLYIGTTRAVDFSSPQSARQDFEADTYTEIGGLNNMGEFGASANVVQFPLVGDDYVDKSKGTRNAGDPAVIVGRISDDPGQIKVREAEKTKYKFNFTLELADAVDENHTNTVYYFRALVAGAFFAGFSAASASAPTLPRARPNAAMPPCTRPAPAA